MGVMKLRLLIKDVQHSVQFASVHMNVGMPNWMLKHAQVNQTNLRRLRDTDADASRIAQFRHSINNNRQTNDDSSTGTDDYKQMVDILIRRSGLFEHYAGPQSFKDWAELKDLKGQLNAVLQNRDRESVQALLANKGFAGLRSVAALAHTQAVNEVQATIGEEITPEISTAIMQGIVEQYNGVAVEFNGETISIADIQDFAKKAGDGITQPTDFTMGKDGWN